MTKSCFFPPHPPCWSLDTHRVLIGSSNQESGRGNIKQTDRQTDRPKKQTDQANKQTTKQTNKQTTKQTNKQTNKQTDVIRYDYLIRNSCCFFIGGMYTQVPCSSKIVFYTKNEPKPMFFPRQESVHLLFFTSCNKKLHTICVFTNAEEEQQ